MLGILVLACFSFIQKSVPAAVKGEKDTIEDYENQIKVPVIRDSIPPPMPRDTLPVPPDSFPVPPPVPDSIPHG